MSLSKPIPDLQIENPELCMAYFDALGDLPDYYKCKVCGIQRKKGNGWTNLISHVNEKHKDDMKDFIQNTLAESKGPLDAFAKAVSRDAKNYHDWIEWIVMSDLPQTFVEDKYTHKLELLLVQRPTFLDSECKFRLKKK
jgi:hypothetical protein